MSTGLPKDVKLSFNPLFLIVWSETRTAVALWRLFCCALAVLLLFLISQMSRYWSCPFTALLSSAHVKAPLLVSPPASWECAVTHSKPSCDGTHRCAILQELYYLSKALPLDIKCPSLGLSRLESLSTRNLAPLATSSGAKQRYYNDKQYQLTLVINQHYNSDTSDHIEGQTGQIDLLIITQSVNVFTLATSI